MAKKKNKAIKEKKETVKKDAPEAIPGAKNTRQLADNVQATLLPPLTDEELAQIDAVTPQGGGRKIWPA